MKILCGFGACASGSESVSKPLTIPIAIPIPTPRVSWIVVVYFRNRPSRARAHPVTHEKDSFLRDSLSPLRLGGQTGSVTSKAQRTQRIAKGHFRSRGPNGCRGPFAIELFFSATSTRAALSFCLPGLRGWNLNVSNTRGVDFRAGADSCYSQLVSALASESWIGVPFTIVGPPHILSLLNLILLAVTW
jgi:hypothetical protein